MAASLKAFFVTGSLLLPIGFVIYFVRYVGRTHFNLEKRLQQHKERINKALISNSFNSSFDSALGSHIFDNPRKKIL